MLFVVRTTNLKVWSYLEVVVATLHCVMDCTIFFIFCLFFIFVFFFVILYFCLSLFFLYLFLYFFIYVSAFLANSLPPSMYVYIFVSTFICCSVCMHVCMSICSWLCLCVIRQSWWCDRSNMFGVSCDLLLIWTGNINTRYRFRFQLVVFTLN